MKLTIILLVLFIFPGYSQKKSSKEQSQMNFEVFEYTDHNQKIQIKKVPEIFIEFHSSNPELAKSNTDDFIVLEEKKNAKIMKKKLSDPSAKTNKNNPLPRNVSEAFLDGNGTMIGLPGGVLLHLEPTWTESDVQSWLSQNSLQLIRKQDISGNWVVVESPAGLGSLELANRLKGKLGVISATPNLWRPISHR
jgi:hypothetical protein